MHAKMKELKFQFKGKNVLLKDVEYMNFFNIHPEEQNDEEIVFQSIEIDSQEIDDENWNEFSQDYVDSLYFKAMKEFLKKY